MVSKDSNYWSRHLGDDWSAMDTRERLLVAAYQEMHCNGFQATGLSQILERAGVTKGALYHHFKNKSELGHAVIDEIVEVQVLQCFTQPMNEFENPIDGLIFLITEAGESFTLQDIQLGCPLHNLAQELAPIDESFRVKLNGIYERWISFMQGRLEQGQEDGFVNKDVDCYQMSILIIATLEGCLSAAKISQDLASLNYCSAGLIQHLNFIRA